MCHSGLKDYDFSPTKWLEGNVFSCVCLSVSHSVQGPYALDLTIPQCTGTTQPQLPLTRILIVQGPPQTWALPLASDTWCQILKTCSNLLTWGPSPWCWNLVATEAHAVGKQVIRIPLECFLVFYLIWPDNVQAYFILFVAATQWNITHVNCPTRGSIYHRSFSLMRTLDKCDLQFIRYVQNHINIVRTYVSCLVGWTSTREPIWEQVFYSTGRFSPVIHRDRGPAWHTPQSPSWKTQRVHFYEKYNIIGWTVI